MSVSKTVEVEVDVSDVGCEECDKDASRAFCDVCFDAAIGDAADTVVAERDTPDAAALVRGWLDTERTKPASDITPAIAALFERCAEDLE